MKQPSNQPSRVQASISVLPEITLNHGSELAIHRQLVDALKRHIQRGSLLPGSRLPPSREAALQLNVGRNTVVDAYANLMAHGLLESRGRLGTFITQPPKPTKTKALQEAHLIRRLPMPSPGNAPKHDWRLGQACVQLLPWQVWRTAAREAGRHRPPVDYGDPRGTLQLREAVATWLARERGVNYSADHIIITQGAGQAIDLLARTLLRPGDHCVVETPGYLRAARAFEAAGARVSAVSVDAQGIDVQALSQLETPALIHVTAANQYPMGGRLSGARRRMLSDLALRQHTMLIENEYDHEFIYAGQNFSPLAATLPHHTALVSTFAKAISPSLRLGFVAAPLQVADALALAVEREHLHVSWPIQCSMQWLLESGELQKHLRRVRRHYAARRTNLLASLAQETPELIVSNHEGGLHLALRCRSQRATQQLMKELARRSVCFQTADDFALQPLAASQFFLAYGQMSEEETKASIRVLKTALRAVGN